MPVAVLGRQYTVEDGVTWSFVCVSVFIAIKEVTKITLLKLRMSNIALLTLWCNCFGRKKLLVESKGACMVESLLTITLMFVYQ